jgi:hypothetical protein
MAEKTHAELKRDLFAAIGLLALAIAYGWGARQIPGSSLIGKGIGAGAVPFALACALAFFSLVLMLRSTLALRRLTPATGPAAKRPSLIEMLKPHRRAFGMLVIGAVFISLLEELGYAISIGLLLLATAWYNGQNKIRPLILFAVGGAIVYYLLFVQLLEIPLPTGFWPQAFPSIFGTD